MPPKRKSVERDGNAPNDDPPSKVARTTTTSAEAVESSSNQQGTTAISQYNPNRYHPNNTQPSRNAPRPLQNARMLLNVAETSIKFPPSVQQRQRSSSINNNEHSQHSFQSNLSRQSALSNLSRAPPTTNAIDEVINEVNHLLQAASEAQALGRLRNSYSSLLLAHQRLVGLGRRVDRSFCEAESEPTGSGEVGEHSNLSSLSSKQPIFTRPLVSQPPLPPTLTQNNYTDVAYVEYLAKSGMELHHKRTGRGMQHEAAIERAAHTAKAKKMEEEQIQKAARGVFALASGGKEGDGGGDETPSKRKGGRGKKPPTLVMHTMAGRNLDVRELMRGVL